MTSFEFIFLQASGNNSLFFNVFFIGAMFLVFYFFIIRPQSKKQKEQSNFMDSLAKGDEVVTASGLLGRINKIEDEIVTLDVGNRTFIRVTKNAISKEMTESVFNTTTTENA